MRVRNQETHAPSYPSYGALKGLVIGTSLTAALALVSCGEGTKEGAGTTDKPAGMKVRRVHLKGDIAPVKKPADTDKDGVIDSMDKCPKVKGTGKDGCPPATKPPQLLGIVPEPAKPRPMPPMSGAPGATAMQPEKPADSDGDGVPDSKDRCKNRKGPASNQGCPVRRLMGRRVRPRPPMTDSVTDDVL